MTWNVFANRYGDILKSYDDCRIVNYNGSPCYLVPRIDKRYSNLHDHRDYLVAQSTSKSAPMVIPVDIHGPRDYLEAVSEVISRYGGASNISKPYATALEKMGYKVTKRPWGNLDFVFSTDVLRAFPGKKHERKRSYINRLEREGYYTRELRSSDQPSCKSLEARWMEDHEGRTSRHGYATHCVDILDELAEPFGVRGVGLFNPDGQMVGFTVAAPLTPTHWSCSFRYANNDVHGASLKIFRDTAALFADYPLECDGDGDGEGSGLWEFKRRLLSDDVMDKQVEMFVIKKR